MEYVLENPFASVMYGDNPKIKQLMNEYRDLLEEKERIERRARRKLEQVAYLQEEIAKKRARGE